MIAICKQVSEKSNIVLFAILFILISFFPKPILEQYRVFVYIFFFAFFVTICSKTNYRSFLFSIKDWSLWIFLVLIFSGTISATDESLALSTYLQLAIPFFLLFYIGRALFYYERDKNLVILVIIICSSIVSLIALLEILFGKNFIYEKWLYNEYYNRYFAYQPRAISTQFNPAVLGSYLLGSLPFSFYLFKKKFFLSKTSGYFLSVLYISVIILTFSRGALLGLIGLVLFYVWHRKGRRVFLIILLGLMLIVGFCSYSRNININRFGFNRFLFGSQDSIFSEYRLNRIKSTIKILKTYPLFGIGFEHFRIRFDEFYKFTDKEMFIIEEFRIPDNMYLTFLAETGIIGTFGFLIFIFPLLRRALRKLVNVEENYKQILLIPLTALIGLLVNMGAYDLFYWNNPYMLFCLICGFLNAELIKKAPDD